MRYYLGWLILFALIAGCKDASSTSSALPQEGARPLSQPLPPEYRNETAIHTGMPKNIALALLSDRGVAVQPAMLQVEGDNLEWPPTGFELNGALFVLFFSLPDINGNQVLTSITWLRTVDAAAPASKTNRQWVVMQELQLPERK